MPDEEFVRQVWTEWESLAMDELSPVHAIAESLGVSTTEVAEVLYPEYPWDDSVEPMEPIDPTSDRDSMYQLFGFTDSRQEAEADAADLRSPDPVRFERIRRARQITDLGAEVPRIPPPPPELSDVVASLKERLGNARGAERNDERLAVEERTRPGRFSGRTVGWVTVLALVAGALFGYFELADNSRQVAFRNGRAVGATDAACWTDGALLWLYETDALSSEEAGRVAVRLSSVWDSERPLSVSEMTELFDRGPERTAAEVYLMIQNQLARAPVSLVPPAEIPAYGQDVGPEVEQVHRMWWSRGAYFEEPAEWWHDFFMACHDLYAALP